MQKNEETTPCPRCEKPMAGRELMHWSWLPSEICRGEEVWCWTCASGVLSRWYEQRAAAGGVDGAIPFSDDSLLPFGVMPMDQMLGAMPGCSGRGVTVAMIDSGFFPHPDLFAKRQRLRAWADTSGPKIRHRFFAEHEPPEWPGWHERHAAQWHGMMTAAASAGTGHSSLGWYRGYAHNADLVFVQTWDENGRITNRSLARALHWLAVHRERLDLRVVNISVGGDPVNRLMGNAVDRAVEELVDAGVVVVAAAGNSARRRVLPPASSPRAITVGGVDTRNSADPRAWRLWHSNWGRSSARTPKPDILAPCIWVVAPVIPDTATAQLGVELFDLRRQREPEIEVRIRQQKFVNPHYQHVDGTSFGAAIVSGIVACLIEASPTLTPIAVANLLSATARPLLNVPGGRQGAGVIQPAQALERLNRQIAQS